MSYDPNNIFAKILREEIPCNKVFENDYALAFRDIEPGAPVHVLVIPKGSYVALDDFAATASVEEQVGFMAAVAEVCKLENTQAGFRAITNMGEDGRQEVPHFHMHVLAGRPLGPMLSSD